MCSLIYHATNVGEIAPHNQVEVIYTISGSKYSWRPKLVTSASDSDFQTPYFTALLPQHKWMSLHDVLQGQFAEEEKIRNYFTDSSTRNSTLAGVNWYYIIAPLRIGLEGHWGKLILVGRILSHKSGCLFCLEREMTRNMKWYHFTVANDLNWWSRNLEEMKLEYC